MTDDDDEPIIPAEGTMLAAAFETHEVFTSFITAGFNEMQALLLTKEWLLDTLRATRDKGLQQ